MRWSEGEQHLPDSYEVRVACVAGLCGVSVEEIAGVDSHVRRHRWRHCRRPSRSRNWHTTCRVTSSLW